MILLEVHDEWRIAGRRYLGGFNGEESNDDRAATKEVGTEPKELLAG